MCEHEYENANCTNCANGLGRLEYECAKTQGKLKEYCHNRAKEHEENIRADEKEKTINECIEIVKNNYRMDALEKLEQLNEQKNNCQ